MINLFGTDGIRGTVGKEPFTRESLINLGSALARWALHKYGNSPRILIAHDTRESCSFVKAALQTGILEHQIKIYDAHILPTPALYLVIKNAAFDCGIIISASHNPYRDNGIKIIDARQGKLSECDELFISQLAQETTEAKRKQTSFGSSFFWPYAENLYLETVASHFPKNFLRGKTVILDCANGATHKLAPRVFSLFGARVIVISASPNGKNINDACGALFPQNIQKSLDIHKADAGFAFDGDGDRVIAVNKHGKIKNGDDILALLSNHACYNHEKTIIGTIMSNKGFEDFLCENKKKLFRTPVGDKYIAEQLNKENRLLGGEQSGHIILRDYLNSGDGIFTALRVMEAIIQNNNIEMNTFRHHPQVLINIPIKRKIDLQSPDIVRIIQKYKQQLLDGRIEVRYSGTEPLLRIMVEGKEILIAKEIGKGLAYTLKKQCSVSYQGYYASID